MDSSAVPEPVLPLDVPTSVKPPATVDDKHRSQSVTNESAGKVFIPN